MYFRKHSIVRKALVVLMLVCTLCVSGCAAFDIPTDLYGRAQFEYHHIFPQEYFGSSGNKVTVRMRGFEHYSWGHVKSNFDKDWEKLHDSIEILNTKNEINGYTEKKAAFIAGANLISYRWLAYDYDNKSVTFPKFLYSMHFDAVSNVIYNVSYIFSVPYKLIRFPILVFSQMFKGENSWSFGLCLKEVIWMIMQLAFGLVSAVFMLVPGFLIGFIFHPLQSLGNILINPLHPIKCNLIASVWDLAMAVIRPIIRIFFRV